MTGERLVKYCSLLAVCFIFAGCTSVPSVDRWRLLEEGRYDVVVDRDYIRDQRELEYAINSFAQDIGAETYSVEKYGPNDFYVTTPGDTTTEDLPQVRHFHAGRTVGATVPPTIVAILVILLIVAL
ncbi:MAG: hypothetical protein LBJ90_08065 [Treponema sp.]|nr:hypothetical protein [Treponema sp.]